MTTAIGSRASAYSVAIDSRDRVVAGVEAGDLALARYRTDGSLDPSFGDGGTVTTDIDGHLRPHTVAIDSRGRIVVAGGEAGDLALARYRTDGKSLDPSFGDRGTVRTAFPGGGSASSVAIRPRGTDRRRRFQRRGVSRSSATGPTGASITLSHATARCWTGDRRARWRQ